MKENKKARAAVAAKWKNPLFIIAAAVILAGILLGIILGAVSCIASRNAIVKYGSTRIDEKTAAYLVSRYKNAYISELGVEVDDTPEFWQTEKPDGVTYGEDFEKSAENFLRAIAVGAYIFDTYAKMDKKTEEAIENSARRAAELYYENVHRTSEYEELFEEDAEAMGYDYDAYVEGEKLLFKYENSRAAFFGSDGGGVLNYRTDCEDYLKLAYSHVELLFVRSETTFELDESGKRVKNADGSYKKRTLTSEEKAERENTVAEIKAYIDAYNGGKESEISPLVIKSAARKYVSDQAEDRIEKGYYVSAASDYYESVGTWDSELKGALDLAMALRLDSSGNAYAYKDLTFYNGNGTEKVWCIMYKSSVEEGAYADADLSDFFTDFYADASVFAHARMVDKLLPEVTVKDGFYEMQVALIPHNDKHKVNEIKE